MLKTSRSDIVSPATDPGFLSHGTRNMSIQPICDRCQEELVEPGGLVFSPPGFPWGMVEKFHLCKTCWFVIRKSILGVVMADG